MVDACFTEGYDHCSVLKRRFPSLDGPCIMLAVDRKYIDEIHSAVELLKQTGDLTTPSERLRESLHRAMRLEASTIPPYLVAAWSIQDSQGSQNNDIRDLILSVAREEMLHMMGVMNIISALGKPPEIATSEMVLTWGTDKLPIGGNLIPVLAPFSVDLLSQLFMEIEKPENPIHYVVLEAGLEAFTPDYGTIGEFYEALIRLINSFETDPFVDGAKHPQIKIEYDVRLGKIGHAPIDDFEIKSRTQAIGILNWIVDQGEGTSLDPLDGNGKPAHYYRFAEIYKGGKLVEAKNEPLGYAYDRAHFPINCDFNRVRQFDPNPKMQNFAKDSPQFRGLQAFNKKYTAMFKELQNFYDRGGTQIVVDSINTMNVMSRFADQLFNLDPAVCPSFEWIAG